MSTRTVRSATQGVQNVVAKPWGNETIVTDTSLPYAGKLIHVLAGHRLSLQIHDTKTETMVLLSGAATLIVEVEQELVEVEMVASRGYTIHRGLRHRLCASEDTLVMEVSTPEAGMTYRLADDYSRADEAH